MNIFAAQNLSLLLPNQESDHRRVSRPLSGKERILSFDLQEGMYEYDWNFISFAISNSDISKFHSEIIKIEDHNFYGTDRIRNYQLNTLPPLQEFFIILNYFTNQPVLPISLGSISVNKIYNDLLAYQSLISESYPEGDTIYNNLLRLFKFGSKNGIVSFYP